MRVTSGFDRGRREFRGFPLSATPIPIHQPISSVRDRLVTEDGGDVHRVSDRALLLHLGGREETVTP